MPHEELSGNRPRLLFLSFACVSICEYNVLIDEEGAFSKVLLQRRKIKWLRIPQDVGILVEDVSVITEACVDRLLLLQRPERKALKTH